MANDISYFKVQGNNTQYSFNDADLESRIGAEEMGTAAQTITGAVAELAGKVGENTSDIETNKAAIGTLSNLTTSATGNLVAAINEVDAHADTNASAISQLNSKFAVAGDVGSIQFGVTDTNLQIRFDCGAARGVYFFNIHRGTAQVSLMRTYNGQTTTIWTLT